MAIQKKLIHFKSYSNFNSKKLSANETDEYYTIGDSTEVLMGRPDILYHSIVFIKDAKKIWTHGAYYDCGIGGNVQAVDTGDSIDDAGDYATKTYVDVLLTRIESLETMLNEILVQE